MTFNQNQPPTVSTVLQDVTSIPQPLYKDDGNNLLAVYGGTTPADGGKVIPGMTIFNRNNLGTVAYAATLPSEQDTKVGNVQSLVCTINSDRQAMSSRVFRFHGVPDGLGEDRQDHLFLHVCPYGEEDTYVAIGGQANLIPLIVAPGSISLAPGLTRDEMQTLGFDFTPEIDFSGLLKGVVQSIPVIAEAGFKIYQEVKGGSSVAASRKAAQPEPEILGAIGAIASAAVPLVGSLISKIF